MPPNGTTKVKSAKSSSSVMVSDNEMDEEQVFLRTLESPKLEMGTMHPPKGANGGGGKLEQKKSKATSRIPKPGRQNEASSIAEEHPPFPSSRLSLSRSSLPTFDTPSSSRQSIELDLSDLGDDQELEQFASNPVTSPLSCASSSLPQPPSPFKKKHRQGRVVETDDERLSSVSGGGGRPSWTSRSGRNLIELEDSIGGSSPISSPATSSHAISSSATTADIKAALQKSKTQFERSISGVKDVTGGSPSSKYLAVQSPELRDLVQPKKLTWSDHESSPIISTHLTFPDHHRSKGSPHAGSFRPPLGSPRPTSSSLAESILLIQSQLNNMKSDMAQKKKELDRLKREKKRLDQAPLWKRFLWACFGVIFFLALDFVLRVVVTKQYQTFSIGSHVDLDQVTAFYKNYFDWALSMVEELRAKGTIPF